MKKISAAAVVLFFFFAFLSLLGGLVSCGSAKDNGVTSTLASSQISPGPGTLQPGPLPPAFVQQVFLLVNQNRQANGAPPLALNADLGQSAQSYAAVMAAVNVMSHTGPDGSTPDTRITAAGYQWTTWGENIAEGYTTPNDVMQAWMNSPGHRANILNPSFKDIGIGFASNYWVQDFGAQ